MCENVLLHISDSRGAARLVDDGGDWVIEATSEEIATRLQDAMNGGTQGPEPIDTTTGG